jgi:hypothetical protein
MAPPLGVAEFNHSEMRQASTTFELQAAGGINDGINRLRWYAVLSFNIMVRNTHGG